MYKKIDMLKTIVKVTFNECIISLYLLIDFLLPDLTILSSLRKVIASFFWSVDKRTRIRKGLRATRLLNIKIGKNCFINKNNLFDNSEAIEIGDNCSIGYDNKFLTVSHIEKDNVRKENKNSFFAKPIKVGSNVWITTNCVILPGTVIGDNVILSANSVAKGLLEKDWVYSGNPAIKIRKTQGILPKII